MAFANVLTKGINGVDISNELALLAASKAKEKELAADFYGPQKDALQQLNQTQAVISPFLAQAQSQAQKTATETAAAPAA